jgi:hypothetical protein
MKREWLQSAILRTASLVVPGNQRAEWIKEWRAEIWYVPRCQATLICLGAFRDALWLRRNNPRPTARTPIRLESPLQCLTFLALLSALSVFFVARLPVTPEMKLPPLRSSGMSVLRWIDTILLTWVLVSATATLAMANRHLTAWASRLRRWIFLALKILLVLPVVPYGFVAVALIGPVVPLAPLAHIAACILAFRWVLEDQRQRCPTCLRLLTNPVRIGTASETFLEWYGAESMCSHGHGLLQVPELATSYCGGRRWLYLDSSWSGLFPEAGGAKQR